MGSVNEDLKELTSGLTPVLVLILVIICSIPFVYFLERHKIKTELSTHTYVSVSFTEDEDIKSRLSPYFIPEILHKFEKDNPSLIIIDKEILWNYTCGYPYGVLIKCKPR